jgi:hypothetical protein
MGAKGRARSSPFLPVIANIRTGDDTISIIRKAVSAVTLAGTLTGAVAGMASHASAVQHTDAGMERYAAAIRKIESTNRYHITANAGGGRTALGAYQILDTNLASWSRAALGRPVSRHEFLRSPHLQDRVFHHRFGHYVKKYGAHGAARAWLGGEGAARGRGGGADRFGSTPSSYAAKFARAMSG